jgi:rubrerythrin
LAVWEHADAACETVQIYRGHKSVTCPLCGTHFQPAHKGKLCPICDVATIGAEASGLRNTLDRR